MSDELRLNFLPHVRQGLSAHSTGPEKKLNLVIDDISDAGTRSTEVAKTLPLLMPSDVLSIAPSMIARVFPSPESTDLKSNLFPSIEFRDADFLWRYAYQTAEAGGRQLSPWLMLVVLQRNGFDIVEEQLSPSAPRKVKTLRPRGGPIDLEGIRRAGLWAWAHVQITGDADPVKLKQRLKGEQEEAILCRLLCPAMLKPGTAYTAFVIPSEDWWPGGANGRGQPVFHSWQFTTAEVADFESLFTRIQEGSLRECFLNVSGVPYIDFSKYGDDARQAPAPGEMVLHTALMPVGASPTSPPVPQAALSAFQDAYRHTTTLEQRCQECKTVRPLVAPFTCSGPSKESTHPEGPMVPLDPYVGLPIYGELHATALPPPPDHVPEPGIPGHQLPWMYEVNTSTPARIAAGLGARVVQENQEELVAYCWQQATSRAAAARKAAAHELGAVLNDKLWERQQAKGLPEANASELDRSDARFRHVASVLPVAQHLPSLRGMVQETKLLAGAMSPQMRKVFAQKLRRNPLGPREPYGAFLSRRLRNTVTGDASAGVPPNTGAKNLYRATAGSIAKVLAPVADQSYSAKVDAELAARLHAQRAETMPSRAAATRSISVPFPMATYLSSLSRDYLVPNLSQLEANRIVVLQVNRKFVEGYLVGLNHEMMRELIWREVPVTTNGTVFTHFWDRNGVAAADISDIAGWTEQSKLGEHLPAGSTVKSVMVIRAELLRHYHDLLIQPYIVTSATPEDEGLWHRVLQGQTVTGFEPRDPLFYQQVGDDVLLLGLRDDKDTLMNQGYVVFSEHPTLPRFGLTEGGAVPARLLHTELAQNHVSWFSPVPGDVPWVKAREGLKEGVVVENWETGAAFFKHSARAARATLQRSLQVVMSFRGLMAP